MKIKYTVNNSITADIFEHLLACDNEFIPPLSSRVDLSEFAEKIKGKAVSFEAWHFKKLIGFASAYFNNTIDRIAFINNVSVLPYYCGRGIATKLLNKIIVCALKKKYKEIHLEVFSKNKPALQLYAKNGFSSEYSDGEYITMKRKIENLQND
jgi:ribosomal protein S18 acetylase RimI-like enzyme